MKILICGLPGAGKTTLARELAPLVGATVFDGDDVRANMPTLGFSVVDRLWQAAHMKWLCEKVTASGNIAIASFICPTAETRRTFNPDYLIWIDRNGNGKYPDTQALWHDPETFDMRVTNEGAPAYWAEKIAARIQPAFSPGAPTALFVGRYQPFHEGHIKLIEEGLKRHGQVCIGVRHTSVYWPFEQVKQRIEARLTKYKGKFSIIPLPNVRAVCYGRDVGYKIEQIDLDEEVHKISASKKRIEANLIT